MTDIYRNLARILSDDRKTKTYKFALLRGTIEIIGENSPYISFENDRVKIPFGLLIEKWILYYYPLLESGIPIPQGEKGGKLAFETTLRNMIRFYSDNQNGGLSALNLDLRSSRIPLSIASEFMQLVKNLRTTITGMPMKHIGYSLNQKEYSIFTPLEDYNTKAMARSNNLQEMVHSCGSYTIPREYFDVFKYLGSFLLGEQSILLQWAQFSSDRTEGKLTVERALQELLRTPTTERDVTISKNIFTSRLKQGKPMKCVWTGKALQDFDLDHLIPFSAWRNNDLWNLLPCDRKTNGNKGNKIPTPDLILKRGNAILDYWSIVQEQHKGRFLAEARISLLGDHFVSEIKQACLEKLAASCAFLINERGFEAWEPKN